MFSAGKEKLVFNGRSCLWHFQSNILLKTKLVGGGAGPGCGLLHFDAQEKLKLSKIFVYLKISLLVSDNKMKIRWNFWLR